MSKKGRVLVAMSGGIDSSLAAVLLHEQGYQVIGMTMKTWDYASAGGSKKETGCCSLDSINDARNIAVNLGFPHYILDIREEFGDYVIDHFTSEYLNGRTPNPCVLCNTHIKWEALLRRADQRTGHVPGPGSGEEVHHGADVPAERTAARASTWSSRRLHMIWHNCWTEGSAIR
jgi:tRNA-specific 2-thiouridylase